MQVLRLSNSTSSILNTPLAPHWTIVSSYLHIRYTITSVHFPHLLNVCYQFPICSLIISISISLNRTVRQFKYHSSMDIDAMGQYCLVFFPFQNNMLEHMLLFLYLSWTKLFENYVLKTENSIPEHLFQAINQITRYAYWYSWQGARCTESIAQIWRGGLREVIQDSWLLWSPVFRPLEVSRNVHRWLQ